MFSLKTEFVFVYEITVYFVNMFYVYVISFVTFSNLIKRS